MMFGLLSYGLLGCFVLAVAQGLAANRRRRADRRPLETGGWLATAAPPGPMSASGTDRGEPFRGSRRTRAGVST